MSKSPDSKNTLYCSFCGKSQHEVRKLIAGPTVFICDECVELCMDIIREEHKTHMVKARDGVPTPREIRKVLAALDLTVTRLIRVAYGPFQLGKLEEGGVEEIPAQVVREQMGAAASAGLARKRRR